jgi:hypothetical protein
MSTEIILVEVSVYEKNLKELLSEYERIHANYISSLRDKNMADAKRLLLQLESMNQEIQLLTEEISQKIKQINQENKFGGYKDAVQTKKNDLNSLNSKMVADETHIKKLLHDTIDLDGKNESLRLQQTSSMYYIYFAILVVIFLSILMFRFSSSTESDRIENIVFFLAILLIIYFCWTTIFGLGTSLVSSASNNINYDSSSLMYRMLN